MSEKCPKCGSAEGTWFDRSITYTDKGEEGMWNRCLSCGEISEPETNLANRESERPVSSGVEGHADEKQNDGRSLASGNISGGNPISSPTYNPSSEYQASPAHELQPKTESEELRKERDAAIAEAGKQARAAGLLEAQRDALREIAQVFTVQQLLNLATYHDMIDVEKGLTGREVQNGLRRMAMLLSVHEQLATPGEKPSDSAANSPREAKE